METKCHEEIIRQYNSFEYIDCDVERNLRLSDNSDSQVFEKYVKHKNFYSFDDDFNISIYEKDIGSPESPMFSNVYSIPISEKVTSDDRNVFHIETSQDIEADAIYILSQLPFFERLNDSVGLNSSHHGKENVFSGKSKNALDNKSMDLEASIGNQNNRNLIKPSFSNWKKTKPKISNEEALKFWKSKEHCIIFSKMTLSLFFSNIGLTLLIVFYILLGACLFQTFELPEELDKHRKYSNDVAENLSDSKEIILATHKRTISHISEAMYFNFKRISDLKNKENKLKLYEIISLTTLFKGALVNTQNDTINKIQQGIFCDDLSNQTCDFNSSTEIPMNKSEEKINKNLTRLNNTFINLVKEVELLSKNLVDWTTSYELNPSRDLLFHNDERDKNDQVFQKLLQEKFESLIETVHKATKDGWIHDYIHFTQEKEAGKILWTFGGSILYCITVITTIGYGHITPKTIVGRIGTIIYAIFGIPIMVICLAHIGALMADTFRLIYCLSCSKIVKKLEKQRNSKRKENSDKTKTSQESIDNNDNNERNEISVQVLKETHKNDNKNYFYSVGLNKIWLHIPNANRLLEAAKESKSIEVPVSVVITVFIFYNLIGSVFFWIYEKWDFIDSFYFSFITLSTIGFGDLVPLATGGDAEQYKSIMCSFYVLIGLSLCVMSFDLLEKKCKSAVKLFLRKIRLFISRKEQQRSKKKSK